MFLNKKNGVKKVILFTTVLWVLYPQIYKQCIISLFNPACSSLDIFLPIPSMDFQPLNVCSKLQYLENLLFCWHDLYPVSTNKKKQCSVGNWCLSASQHKCEKHQASTNHWSLTHLASTNFIFGLSLNICNTPFHFPFWQEYLSIKTNRAHKWLSI